MTIQDAILPSGWIKPDAVFDGQSLVNGAAVRLDNGCVVDISDDGLGHEVAGIITPGFFDLQVNGGGGVLYNQTPTNAGAARIASAHQAFGTDGILATLITDTPQVLDAAAADLLAGPMPDHVKGIHIEGPHISLARKGTHKPQFVRPMDQRTIDVVARLRAADIPVLITVAPEATDVAQIAELADLGAVVSLGHTDCDAETANAAFAAGAQLVTHLFNAMSQMHGRAPGLVGAALNSDAYASIICDGIHVDRDMIGLAFRSRPNPDCMILVSDAMPTVGGPDVFDLYGNSIALKNGQLLNADNGLAGAHLTMRDAVRFCVETVEIGMETALRAAITSPAKLMGLSAEFSLAKGSAAYLLTPDWQMTSVQSQSPEPAVSTA